MIKNITALFLVASFTQASSGSAAEHLIDMLSPTPMSVNSAPQEGQIDHAYASESTPSSARAPLAIIGVTLDRAAYAPGDQFSFELIVKHVGDIPQTFPTSTDGALFPEHISGGLAVFLTFTSERENPPLDSLLAGVSVLMGAPSIEGSLITIAPGDTVRIRGAAIWQTRTPATREVLVRPTLHFKGFDPVYAPAPAGGVARVSALLP